MLHPVPPTDLAPSDIAARSPVATVLGHRMALHDAARDKYVSPVLAHAGYIEPFETELILNEVRPGDVVLDIGAHIGYYTLLLARSVGPSGKVLAFEPDPLNFALLKRNVEMNGYGNVELFNAAVSDRCGRSRLFHSADNAGDHRLYESADEPRRSAIDAETLTLDSVFADRAGRVDFIKMDVQGSEGVILEGMANLLARCPRVKMMMEFWPLGLVRSGYGAGRLLARLMELGFRVYEVSESDLSMRWYDSDLLLRRYPVESQGFTNLLCVKVPPVVTTTISS